MVSRNSTVIIIYYTFSTRIFLLSSVFINFFLIFGLWSQISTHNLSVTKTRSKTLFFVTINFNNPQNLNKKILKYSNPTTSFLSIKTDNYVHSSS